MLLILTAYVVAALLAAMSARALGPRSFLVAGAAPLLTFAWALVQMPSVLDGTVQTEQHRWIPELGLTLSLRLDAFALLMVLLVSGIGVLVMAYSASYFAHADRPLGATAVQLVLFAGAMVGLVLSDDVLLLFVFWELTSITSFLLIGTEHERGDVRARALQALLVTSAGGLAMLAGLVLLAQAAGTTSLSGIIAAAPRNGTVPGALVLVLVGAFAKSAQMPFHFWLPGAMAAPTPVSAYLHSATMVKAGIYLVARLAPAFAPVAPWRPLVLAVGLTTMTLGGWRALREHDLKLVLAWGTISQLGFMITLFGAGEPSLALAGCAVLLAHALFKSALFMVVGVIDHQAHTRDLRRLQGLGRRLPVLATAGLLAAASMAAFPPLFGFVAKELALDGWLHADLTGAGVVLAVTALASVLTVAYALRFAWGAFASKPPSGIAEPVPPASVARPGAWFVAPAAVLAALGLVAGLVPATVDHLVTAAAAALAPMTEAEHLALWHGLTTTLALSAIVFALGIAMFAARRTIERGQARIPRLPDAPRAYEGLVRGLNRVADRTTGVVQRGSLPAYIGVVLLTLLALPGVELARKATWPSDLHVADSPFQIVAGAAVLVAALATILASKRFAAVLALGAAGYGVAVLFVLQGAPDLALTQLLVETLSVVVFVLVLRRLPARFPPRRRGQVRRALLAGAVGTFVAMFLLIAGDARTEPPVSREQVARSEREAGGRNVVNVIVVDFRGFDTLGEITVLTVAGLGVASLVLANRRDRDGEAREPRAEVAS